eukprot:2138203-Rhodomonas_salina.2
MLRRRQPFFPASKRCGFEVVVGKKGVDAAGLQLYLISEEWAAKERACSRTKPAPDLVTRCLRFESHSILVHVFYHYKVLSTAGRASVTLDEYCVSSKKYELKTISFYAVLQFSGLVGRPKYKKIPTD